MSYLGLDVGTSGCKAVVFDKNGNTLASAYRAYGVDSPHEGWAEQDAKLVGEECFASMAEAAGQVADDPVRALAISSQGEAFAPVDRAGTPLATTLLNLSIEGLACRARQVDLTEIEAGPALGIEFEPQGADGSFHLFGRIVSVTPGGTLESVVIGIAFFQDEGWKASRVGLQAALVTAHW